MNTKQILLACHRGALIAAVVTCCGATAFAQEQPAAERPAWQSAIEDFRKRADERMKVLLEATDDEYSVLKPRIEKLQRMQMASDSRMMGFGMMMGRGGNMLGGNRPAAGQDASKPAENPMTPIMKYLGIEANPAVEKAKEMQAALESNEASNELLKRRLAELRAAKKQVKEEMTRAQEELRALCTVRQETVLVLMGLLE